MNQQSTPAGSIAVGVDGSACAGLALDWATEEATRRKLPLHIVHAFSYQYPMTSAGMGFVIEGVREIAEELCERAVAHVNTTHPDLTVTWDVSTYGAASAPVGGPGIAHTVAIGAGGMVRRRSTAAGR